MMKRVSSLAAWLARLSGLTGWLAGWLAAGWLALAAASWLAWLAELRAPAQLRVKMRTPGGWKQPIQLTAGYPTHAPINKINPSTNISPPLHKYFSAYASRGTRV